MREHAEVGAVRQLAQYRQPAVALHADDQVGPGAGDAGHLRVPGEVPVGQYQHPGTEVPAVDELVQQQRLAGAHRRPGRVDQGPGAAGDQGQQPDLRIPARPDASPGRIAERPAVRWRVRDVQPGAVGGNLQQGQFPAERRHPRQVRGSRHRPAQPAEQHFQRRPAQAAPGLDRGRHRGNPPPAHPGLGPELPEQHPEHFAVAGSRAEPQRQHEVQRHPGGQGTAADLPAAALLDHLIHQ